jgi:NAD(P)-dependent dehydrogenase (short-subunit alcohol dehydrogenase family)
MDAEERLEKLERELCVEKRRTRWLLAAVLVRLVGGGLAWTWGTITATSQGANIGWKVIRATQFILEDENEKLRAGLAGLQPSPLTMPVGLNNAGILNVMKALADVVAFLASECASYITGSLVLVDGGLHRAMI